MNTSMLRYWEKEFGALRPKRTNKGDRLYTKDDIAKVRDIQHLLKERGFTIQGARDQLRKPVAPEQPTSPGLPVENLRDRLQFVRQRLLELRGHE